MTEHSEFTHVGYLGGGPCDWNEDSARLNYFEDSQLINQRLIENIKGLFFIIIIHQINYLIIIIIFF